MQSAAPSPLPSLTIALDIGNRFTEICVLDAAGAVVERDRVRTTAEALRQRLAVGSTRVVLEVGCDSPWISRLLHELGHEVLVANARAVALINRSDRKTDRSDAEKLARLARVDPALLQPIQHRSEATQCDLAVARARDQLVALRTALINHVRGTCKALGERPPMCSAEAFAKKASTSIPKLLEPALRPLMAQIASISQAIADFDRQIERLSRERYPATQLLRQVRGVGPVTAFCFVLTIEDPSRFVRSRQVGGGGSKADPTLPTRRGIHSIGDALVTPRGRFHPSKGPIQLAIGLCGDNSANALAHYVRPSSLDATALAIISIVR